MIGSELMKRMQEQIRLEDIYNVSIQKADGAFMAAMDNDDVRETLEKLQKNTRELCRKMKDKPTIVADLRNFQETRPANVVQLLRTLADMQDVTLKRLTTTVEEERSRQELLQHYIERESQAKQNQLLRQHEKCMKEHQEKHKAMEQKFEEELARHRAKYKELKQNNKDAEVAKLSKKRRAETDLMGVIKEYDTTITELTTDYETEKIHYQKEQKELEELEEHFAKVDMENLRLEQEAQILAARRNKQDSKRKREDEMATLVQSYWKAILDREQFTKEKKLKKKKAKGGKKK